MIVGEKLKFTSILLIFQLLVILSSGCSVTNLCNCKWSTPGIDLGVIGSVGSVSIGVCTLVPGISNIGDEYKKLENALSSVQNDIENVKQEIEDFGKMIAALADGSVITETVDALKKVQTFGDDFVIFFENDITGVVEDAIESSKNFADIVAEIDEHITYDFDELFSDVADGFMSSADSIFAWVFDAFTNPKTGVWKDDVIDCWANALEDGSISFSIGGGTGPSVGVAISFVGNEPLTCFLSKVRLFSSHLASNSPEFGGSIDFSKRLLELATGLRDASIAFQAVTVDTQFCNKSFSTLDLEIDTDNLPFDWLKDFVEGINTLNDIVTEGALSETVRIIKIILCGASSIPGGIFEFSDSLVNYLENKNFNIPETVVYKLFSRIDTIGSKFIEGTRNENLADNTNLPCLLRQWGNLKLKVTFGISMEVNILTVNPFEVSAGISCGNLDCIGCVMGTGFELVSSKRSADADISVNTTQETIKYVFGDKEKQCIEYRCEKDGNTWDPSICTCVCADASDIWTPQYGCYNAENYENGDAPDEANPKANPFNEDYDSTLDPYSDDYNSELDTDPYYDPFELNGGSVVTLAAILALICLFV
eukprot:TRINITY_DN3695_c0_g1_i1.p1 TRINITY_DN3695_c0_g1~~TRINITY_DN3695_c0_g1_i1.p1  ORF type:complete len:595 (+),score=162.74 TRINITY_DN3695_c0_g1_i1:180-1964(+)